MMKILLTKLKGEVDLTHCYEIRRQVFIEGQNISKEIELDGLDQGSTHYLLSVEGQGVGTARVRFISPNQAKIERVAILPIYQGQGLGTKLMELILTDLRQHAEINTVCLSAQIKVVPFYEKLGFIAYGEIFWEAAIKHQSMKLNFEQI